MRRILTLLLLCGGLLSGPGWTEPLRLATFEYPPYMTNQNGHAEGLMIDLLNEVFSRMAVKVEYEFLPLARAINDVQYGQVDGLFTLKKTATREQLLTYPLSMLLRQDYHFFTLKNSEFSFDGNLQAVAPYSIGLLNKASYGRLFDDAVKSHTLTRLDYANSHMQSFKKLLGHRLDAVICSKQVGLALIHHLHAEDQIKISGPKVSQEGSYIVFTRQRDFTRLAHRFDQTLISVIQDGTYARIMHQYPADQISAPTTLSPAH